jgi:hypothetical protein
MLIFSNLKHAVQIFLFLVVLLWLSYTPHTLYHVTLYWVNLENIFCLLVMEIISKFFVHFSECIVTSIIEAKLNFKISRWTS